MTAYIFRRADNPDLVVYRKTEYQKLFNLMSDMAEHDNQRLKVGEGIVAVEYTNPHTNVRFWVERHEF